MREGLHKVDEGPGIGMGVCGKGFIRSMKALE
jgi:hypothetical protein